MILNRDGITDYNEKTQILLNNVFGMTDEEVRQLGREELMKLITVDVTTPDGETIKLAYANGVADVYYTYTCSQGGNKTFKATNSRGKSSEITVPIKTFSLKLFPELALEIETKKFAFFKGQTWEDYFMGYRRINEIKFQINDNGTIEAYTYDYTIIGERGESPIIYIKDGDDYIEVKVTDEIIENGVYYWNAVPWVE